MRTQSPALVVYPYLSLKPWPELVCLGGDLTIEFSSKACKTSGLQSSFRKTLMRHLLSWDDLYARAFEYPSAEFCKEPTSVFIVHSVGAQNEDKLVPSHHHNLSLMHLALSGAQKACFFTCLVFKPAVRII